MAMMVAVVIVVIIVGVGIEAMSMVWTATISSVLIDYELQLAVF